MRVLFKQKIIYISKPRCGSTSVRKLIDKLSNSTDLSVDFAGQFKTLHPHMTIQSINSYLESVGIDFSEFKSFTITRDPLEMLWSYYNFFMPDDSMRFNYEAGYNGKRKVDFCTWLSEGRVGLINNFSPKYQDFITNRDFSPLSLNAHVCDCDGNILVDKIFKLESLSEVEEWLSSFDFESEIIIETTNSSEKADMPDISKDIIELLKCQMPMDFELYGY